MDVWSDRWNPDRTNNRAFDTMKRIALEAVPIVDDLAALAGYARQNRLTVKEIIYYFNAWEAGGDEGLEAIRNPDIIPADFARQRVRQIEKTLAAAVVVPFRVTDEGTALGVYQIRSRGNVDRYLEPVCQLRLTLETFHWHLYWMRKFDAWWPYPPDESDRFPLGLPSRLRQVLEDVDGCFWI